MELNTLTKINKFKKKEIIKKSIMNKLKEIELYLIEKLDKEDNLYDFSFKITSDNINNETIMLEIEKECCVSFKNEVNIEKNNLIDYSNKQKKRNGLFEIIGDKNSTLNYPYYNFDVCYYNDYKKKV